jgi:hypothetical protein
MLYQSEPILRAVFTINKITIQITIRTSIPAIMESKGDTIAIISSF